jgi:L-ascorbate metabolism protein UlaG (beta-lactamase superfamily)
MTRLRHSIPGHRGSASFADLMKWQFSGQRAKWPRRIENATYPAPPSRVDGDDLSVTWIGHSTSLVQTAGLNFLTDPFFSERASPVSWAGPRRVRPPAFSAAELPPIDVVLVSHNHYDHMDLRGLAALARHHAPLIVTPTGNAKLMGGAVGGLKMIELGWGESHEVDAATISVTPSCHWSKRGLFDTNRALWGAFAIETPGGIIYFAGDTGYGGGRFFRDLRDRFGRPRLALLPIGAYEPRWFMEPQHMNPADAVMAHLDLGAATSLAIHHGTVQLTDEPIDAPTRALVAAMTDRGIDPASFLVPDIGETLAIP